MQEGGLLSITKLQNLKAIHNSPTVEAMERLVVINHKTTKFESNSQRSALKRFSKLRCYQSQNYKIWKQFTTSIEKTLGLGAMLSITKLQNLKAIHNTLGTIKKQVYDVINHKTTKFESSSQQTSRLLGNFLCCYQSQNYKIWKQFTTKQAVPIGLVAMLSITKLQNLKAIHNLFV